MKKHDNVTRRLPLLGFFAKYGSVSFFVIFLNLIVHVGNPGGPLWYRFFEAWQNLQSPSKSKTILRKLLRGFGPLCVDSQLLMIPRVIGNPLASPWPPRLAGDLGSPPTSKQTVTTKTNIFFLAQPLKFRVPRM